MFQYREGTLPVARFISYAAFQLLWLDGDIVCLQEVDQFYFPFLLEELGGHGYDGIYKQHDTEHGLATFYKRTRFEMKSSEVYGFTELLGDLGDVENLLKESNTHNQRYAQYTTLQDLHSGKEVVIGLSCILYSMPRRKNASLSANLWLLSPFCHSLCRGQCEFGHDKKSKRTGGWSGSPLVYIL